VRGCAEDCPRRRSSRPSSGRAAASARRSQSAPRRCRCPAVSTPSTTRSPVRSEVHSAGSSRRSTALPIHRSSENDACALLLPLPPVAGRVRASRRITRDQIDAAPPPRAPDGLRSRSSANRCAPSPRSPAGFPPVRKRGRASRRRTKPGRFHCPTGEARRKARTQMYVRRPAVSVPPLSAAE